MASKREATARDILRAAAVVTVEDGCVALPPQVLDYLGAGPEQLLLKIQKEILRMPRTGSRREHGRTVYPLQMPCDFAPCGLIPIRAFARARGERIRAYAGTYLWDLVAKQDGREGADPGWNRYTCGHAGLLQILAAFDHLAAKIGIMKWVSWIVEAQNPDGSWGRESHCDAATFAVVSALRRVSDLLPNVGGVA